MGLVDIQVLRRNDYVRKLKKYKMASNRGTGHGRGRGRPPINRRQTEEHSHTEIQENEGHVSHAESKNEEHVSHTDSRHEERFTLEPDVRKAMVEEVGLVL
ncbi:hypothetical protein L1987_18723 [Smallanthus sonchifolius]|uniref:Uncharacterized protein n=1 Tax=Smallanthus sonchifolius TaxID=185202 RepID=A0ACB9J2I3_9ASTR|nr:hypothetical protein L1987_18723 [Smallanthus sonchifolius]